MNFGEKLYRLRVERGIYQKQLAAYLHVSVGTISNYENGIHSPDLKTLSKLASYFRVSRTICWTARTMSPPSMA